MTDVPELGISDVLGEETANPPTPRPASNVIFAFGQEYPLSACEARIKGQYEQWMRKRALKAISECGDDPEMAQGMREAYLDGKVAGSYNWGGKAWQKSVMEIDGTTYLLYLLMRRCNPEVTEEVAATVFKAEPKQATDAILWALKNAGAPVEPGKKKNPNQDLATLD